MSLGLIAPRCFKLIVNLHQEAQKFEARTGTTASSNTLLVSLTACTIFFLSINYSALVTFYVPVVIRGVEAMGTGQRKFTKACVTRVFEAEMRCKRIFRLVQRIGSV